MRGNIARHQEVQAGLLKRRQVTVFGELSKQRPDAFALFVGQVAGSRGPCAECMGFVAAVESDEFD